MKKALFSLSLILSLTAVVRAQETTPTNKWPSTSVLPEAGDWAIGFDVVPLFKAAGNLFHSPSGNDSVFSPTLYTIEVLHVKNATTAYRFGVRVGISSASINNLVTDDANPTTLVTDKWTQSDLKLTFLAGIQKTRGKGRLRGIYGIEGAILIGSHSNTFDYGNPMKETGATSTNFGVRSDTTGFASSLAASRPTEQKDGFMFGIEAIGFLGVEYFFAPKMSFSAEYGWGLGYATIGEGTTTYELWTGGSGGSATTATTRLGNSSGFKADVLNATSIIFHLYF